MLKESFTYFLFFKDSAPYSEPRFSLPLLLILHRRGDKQMMFREKISYFSRFST